MIHKVFPAITGRWQQLFLLLLLATWISPISAGDAGPDPARTVLAKRLNAILADLPEDTDAGIAIIDLSTGEILFSIDANNPMIPASNMKLFTTAAALDRLGPEFQFETKLLSPVEPLDGKLDGDLILRGSGDPSLVQEQLWRLADSVRKLGISRITGNIVMDDTYFDSRNYPDPSWQRIDNRYSYNAPTSAVAFNFNAVGVEITPGRKTGDRPAAVFEPFSPYFNLVNNAVTGGPNSRITLILDVKETGGACTLTLTGSLPINCRTQTYWRHLKQPAMYCGLTFHHYLTREGIRIDGAVIKGTAACPARVLTSHLSHPLAALLRDANKYSNNFMLEQILKTLGAECSGKPGSTESGLGVVRDYLIGTGMRLDGFQMFDGSGLSDRNRATPAQLVYLLRHIIRETTFCPEYISCLPVAGTDGTLKNRFKNGLRQRLIRAKTGVINGSTCLSGIVDGRKGEGLGFALLFNTPVNRHNHNKSIQDDILGALLDYRYPVTSP
ncbi:D-alanyl-D-alanine carboxypeptidase/D-alanyl-D-alanine-endopeptidase [bacterium]|nr:D-alanyl-D-alanine carboxypeptidase/D-alanyl-D-alanine-endopeptidase [candidate division CSSED10-310 bacterium]